MKSYNLWIVLLLMTVSHFSYAQQSELEIMAPYVLSGAWVGELTQEAGGIAKRYQYEVDLTLEGNKISGKGILTVGNMFGDFEISGYFDGQDVFLEDIKITNENIRDKAAWCIKRMPLKLLFKKGEYCLEGSWSGYTSAGQCSPGRIYLKKIAIKA